MIFKNVSQSQPGQRGVPYCVVFEDVLQHKDDVCERRSRGVRFQPAITHDVKAAGSNGCSCM